MPKEVFFEQKRASPTSLVVVVAVHAAAIAALALAKIEVPNLSFPGPIEVRNIPIEQDPPPVPPEPFKAKTEPRQKSVISPPQR